MNRSGFSCDKADAYLGDGVYIKWDESCCQVWLLTLSGDEIALDYPMVSNLMKLMEDQ